MSRYIHDIVKHFFHHEVSDEIASRVQDRLALSPNDADDAFREIWDSLKDETMDEDVQKDAEKEVQKLTDKYVRKMEEMADAKSKEVLKV